jgi:hypothetical protein
MIFGKWDERSGYSRGASGVTTAAIPVATPSAPAIVPGVETKTGSS